MRKLRLILLFFGSIFNLHLTLSYSSNPNLFQLHRPLDNHQQNLGNDLTGHARRVNSEGGKREYFDLSYTLDDDSIFFPGQRFGFHLMKDIGPTINKTSDGYRYSYAMWSFCMSEHGGTHIDAPYHWNKFGWRMAEIPLERLVDVPAVVIDVDHLVFSLKRPETFLLDVEHILDHESEFGEIPRGAVVMVRYGWGKFWPDKLRYMGWDNSTGGNEERPPLHIPGMSANAANWLLKERQIVGFGSDTISVLPKKLAKSAYLFKQDNPIHIILQENQVYIIENIANLDNLLRKTRPNNYHQSNRNCNELRLSVLPIKTLGTGGPVRLVAYCRDW